MEFVLSQIIENSIHIEKEITSFEISGKEVTSQVAYVTKLRYNIYYFQAMTYIQQVQNKQKAMKNVLERIPGALGGSGGKAVDCLLAGEQHRQRDDCQYGP